MAIAYFIPDQTKLLARTAGNGNRGSSINNTNNNVTPSSNQTSPPASAPSIQPPQQQDSSNNFRASVTIPLPPCDGVAAQAPVGCWDLITQVFCYALRFYHESNRNPAVIQISFEVRSGSPAPAQQHQPNSACMPQAPDQHSPSPPPPKRN